MRTPFYSIKFRKLIVCCLLYLTELSCTGILLHLTNIRIQEEEEEEEEDLQSSKFSFMSSVV
jgi:hypothetical protein